MKTDFYKCCGATERHDALIKIGETSYLLIYGFGTDEDGTTYDNRKYYDHNPTIAEMRADIDALINASVDEKILSGFVWNGKPVWLSAENQMNFKSAYDITVQTDGATLPIKFKLGEDADGTPVYHTFTKIEPFGEFILKAFAHINNALNEGWKQKDSVDYDSFVLHDE